MDGRLGNALQKQSFLCNKEFEKDDGTAGISDVEADGLQVFATIRGPEQTAFVGGKFRVKLVISHDFPQSPPKAFFQTKIFHPNINLSTGDVCVNALQKDWDPQQWSLAHIFRVIRCLLIIPFPESALNQDAAKMFMECYDDFVSHAKMLTQLHAITQDKQAVLGERSENLAGGQGTTSKKKKSALRRL